MLFCYQKKALLEKGSSKDFKAYTGLFFKGYMNDQQLINQDKVKSGYLTP
jgi:hypothetical protein